MTHLVYTRADNIYLGLSEPNIILHTNSLTKIQTKFKRGNVDQQQYYINRVLDHGHFCNVAVSSRDKNIHFLSTRFVSDIERRALLLGASICRLVAPFTLLSPSPPLFLPHTNIPRITADIGCLRNTVYGFT